MLVEMKQCHSFSFTCRKERDVETKWKVYLELLFNSISDLAAMSSVLIELSLKRLETPQNSNSRHRISCRNFVGQ